jgi:long-chain acyl-CoA synthetase
MIGGEIRYIRSRNPRVIFEALREHRVTTMVVTPQLLDIFWKAIMREVERQGRERPFDLARRAARRLPFRVRRLLFRAIHARLGGALRLMVAAGAYLPPELQQGWEDLGVTVLQGYGATEVGAASATSEQDHPTGTVGRTVPPVRLRLDPTDNEILVAGPAVTPGYWRDPEATAAAIDADGWYRTGDIGRIDERGNLVLSGRKRNVIVLPNGFNVFPEDIENILEEEGLAQAVVLETEPGRIEAVILPPGSMPVLSSSTAVPERPADEEGRRELEAAIDRIIKRTNERLSAHSRIAAWRLWPDPDFPRTHTLKIKRADVHAWAAGGSPIPLYEAGRPSAT